MADRPTKPGYYWWRPSEGSDWQPVQVYEMAYWGFAMYLLQDADAHLIGMAEGTWGPEIVIPEGLIAD
ncbi:MAG: hypothetical protein Q7T04_00680 [Dehalococcoidia bacterium]|nr:hypothetical protein [Dehalococcoidia bacterium]